MNRLFFVTALALTACGGGGSVFFTGDMGGPKPPGDLDLSRDAQPPGGDLAAPGSDLASPSVDLAAPTPDLAAPTPDLAAGPSCNDGRQNGNETDIDCGGGSCAKCSLNRGCVKNTDCQSALCKNNLCVPVPSCNDLLQNGSETDVDCGGANCPKCGDGRACALATDCQSGNCQNNTCAAAASCNDGLMNGKETDVDCGGGCPKCADGNSCLVNTDCVSAKCANNVCAGNVNAVLVGTSVGFKFYKVPVVGKMTDTNILAACKAVGLTVGCQGPLNCMYNDNACKITGEDSCSNPMQRLATTLGCAKPASCAGLEGVYQYMGHKWQTDSACGVEGALWCKEGNTISNRFGLCVQ